MMSDLFSSLDFSSVSNLILEFFSNLVWILGVIWFFFILNKYFWKFSRSSSFSSAFLKTHMTQTSSSSGYNQIKGSYGLKVFFFFLILGCKFWGLFPYIFGNTSQILFVLIFSLVVWSTIVFSKFFFSFKAAIAPLFPFCPRYLLPLLSVVEVFSLVLRPLTLSLRLAMKMTTGHMVIGLISGFSLHLFLNLNFFLFLVWLILFSYFIFEMCICFIQSIVFSLLCSQYLGEHKML